jgi:WD40 repeat protein
MALVDEKGVLHVWQLDGKVLCRIAEPAVGEDQATFSPDGQLVAVKHMDDVIRIWDVTAGKVQCSIPPTGQRRFPHPHAFSPDGRLLATAPGSLDHSAIRLWDTNTGKEAGRFSWADNTSPTCLLFCPDGKSLIAAHGLVGPALRSGNANADVSGLRLWDVTNGRELCRLAGVSSDVRAIAVSPDGRTLAAAGRDGVVVLWEAASGKERARFKGHRDWVWSLAFSPDGRLLASASLDHTVLVWDMVGMGRRS